MSATATDQRPPDRPARRENVPLGILCMIGATVMFTITNVISKWLAETYPVGEVLTFRAGTAMIVSMAFILPQAGFAAFQTQKLPQHALRGFSQFISQSCILIAFTLMPLAAATAINFSAPLFAALLSALILRETIGWARGLALVAGFIGVLIVVRPGAETFQIGALFALANAVLYGSVTVGVRGMTSTESTSTLILYQSIFLTILFATTLPFAFVTPTWRDLGVMVINGVLNALAQVWWTRALHLAPTPAVAPFNYFMLVWTMIAGWFLWGEVPTVWLLLGSAIVVASGLFLLWRESGKV